MSLYSGEHGGLLEQTNQPAERQANDHLYINVK
jgi:hypothetical protein